MGNDADLVTIAEGAAAYGCHPQTLFRRIADGEIVAFVGSDRRRRYVRLSDIEQLRQPKPVTRRDKEPTMSRPAA